jgi:hypothetical protein
VTVVVSIVRIRQGQDSVLARRRRGGGRRGHPHWIWPA